MIQKVESFDVLGNKISMVLSGKNQALYKKIEKARINNGWFTKESVDFSLRHWVEILDRKQLIDWLSNSIDKSNSQKNVLVLMAGNVPLVGFHDVLSVLLSGHRLLAKPSSKDQLMRVILEELIEIDPYLNNSIEIIDGFVQQYDAVIATGSNNSSGYFEHYFGHRPMILRRSRTSVGILDGNETEEDLNELAKDIFIHFGLGCRNVTKLYLPIGFDLDRLFKSFYKNRDITSHNKYYNNYNYYKALFLAGRETIWDNGFLILREHQSLFSPISTVHYQYYNSIKDLKKELNEIEKDIQCIVTHLDGFPGCVPFGKTQCPKIDHYADGINTLKFLQEI